MAKYKEAVEKKLSEMKDGDSIMITSMRHPELFISCAKEFMNKIPYFWNHFLFTNDYSELKKVNDYEIFEE